MRLNRLILIIVLIILIGVVGYFKVYNSPNILRCKTTAENYTAKVVAVFKEDKPVKYRYKDKMIFPPLAAEAELYSHSKAEEYGTLIAEKFARMGNHSDNITLKITYNYTKDHSAQEDKLLVGREDSQDNARKKLESLGYKCN